MKANRQAYGEALVELFEKKNNLGNYSEPHMIF